MQLSCILSSQPELSLNIEVQRLTLGLAQLTSHTDVMLLPRLFDGRGSKGIRHAERTIFMGDESLQSSLHVFVEAFEQCQSEGVLHLEVLRLVVDRVIAILQSLRVVLVQIVARRCLVGLIDMIVIVQFEGMDETGDRHVFTFHCGIDGVLDGLQAIQTVDGSLAVHLDTGRVSCDVQGVFDICGFLSHDLGTLRTTRGGFLDGFPCIASAVLLLISFFGFLLLTRLLSKLLRLDLCLSHLYHPVESDVIAVGEENVLVVVSVPVL